MPVTRTIAALSGLSLAAAVTIGAVHAIRAINSSLAWHSCLTERQRDSFSPAASINICRDRLK